MKFEKQLICNFVAALVACTMAQTAQFSRTHKLSAMKPTTYMISEPSDQPPYHNCSSLPPSSGRY